MGILIWNPRDCRSGDPYANWNSVWSRIIACRMIARRLARATRAFLIVERAPIASAHSFYLSGPAYLVSMTLAASYRTVRTLTDTLDLALEASGCDQVHVVHKPRLLSDNGSSYVSGDLAEWLQNKGMKHSRGAPYHPQTQGKTERWHQTLKNRILLESYFLPGDLEAQIEAFVDHYNHQRYHESLNNVTPADVYFGRDKTILKQRERIKRKTLEQRRLHHRQHAA